MDLDHEMMPLSCPRETLDSMNGPREPQVAILLSVYLRSGYRSPRDLVRHGLAATVALAAGVKLSPENVPMPTGLETEG